MSVETHIYDSNFFDNTKKFEADSAKAFVNSIVNHLSFSSVVDIGCGVGIYLAEFKKIGKEVLGYDGAPAAIHGSLVGDNIKLHDLSLPLHVDKKFDICLCMEVAEHLPESAAETLVDTLTGLSDTIIFTAATPGQGSREIGHINEQPHEYWIKFFATKNFTFEKELSFSIRHELNETGVVWWIAKNFMLFKRGK